MWDVFTGEQQWQIRLTNLTFFLLSLLFIYFGSPLGPDCLAKPIATLKCSLQLPNQRRCLNQWGGWILTGICNEHQPVGIDVSSPPCVCIHEALKSFRPSPGRSFLSWSRRSTFGKSETCKGVNESSNRPRNRSTKTRVQRLGAKSMYLSWGGSTDPVDQSQPPWRLWLNWSWSERHWFRLYQLNSCVKTINKSAERGSRKTRSDSLRPYSTYHVIHLLRG